MDIRSPTVSPFIFNLSAIAVLVICLALVSKGVADIAELMLGAILVAGAAWVWGKQAKRAGHAAKEPSQTVKLLSGLFPVILVIFLLRSFMVEPFAIPSESMLPTLQEGDFILVNKHAYGIRLPVLNRKVIETSNPVRGDVVVFRLPDNPKLDYIKRVIGLPGDLVVYANKKLTINNQMALYNEMGEARGVFGGRLGSSVQYAESIQERRHTVLMTPGTRDYYPQQVKRFPYQANCAYRENGFACRVPAGHYLVLGDNRDGSNDSRYWGFVPDENLVGRASMVWMNFRSPSRIGSKIL